MAEPRANPLLQDWNTPFGLPPFAQIRAEHFLPAFERAFIAHEAEIAVIRDAADAPTFDNTIAALDRCGRLLGRVSRLFFNLAASETSAALQEVERSVAPLLARHRSAVLLDGALYARIDAVHAQRAQLALAAEELRLVERMHLDVTRAGAALPAAARERLAEINAELATLTTRFAQNVLAEEAAFALVLREPAALAGLPADLRAAARSAALERGLPDAWAITLSRSLIVPFLTYSDRRDLRERAFRAWTCRGEHDGEHDNRPVIAAILALRAELARLHGYATYADYALVDRMARTPEAVRRLLDAVWVPARAKAATEAALLAALARESGCIDPIEPWDWRYWAEKVRAARFGFDASLLQPYLSFDAMQDAAFDTARRLFGVEFVARPDVAAYHPDVRVYEVRDARQATLGVFIADPYARATKRGGAWMSAYRLQSRSAGAALPVIVNNNNFAKAAAGAPTPLSVDDLRTLFHEFGHGLHGLLSDVTYERLSGTQVLADFVELPSQLFEHWAFEPAVLARHARHHATGEPIPQALQDGLRAARQWNQGFETVEYTACALVDLALHARPEGAPDDLAAFEAAELDRLLMPREIALRHRLPHFGHLFAGSAYAAGYYVYLWAEVLDADAYDAFAEAGDPFAPEVAARLRRYVYAAGARLDPAAAFRAFRGRDPRIEPMLRGRGLSADEAAVAAAPAT